MPSHRRIDSISGIPVGGGTIGLVTNPIVLNFSEDLQTTGVNAVSTYVLRSAGADDQFDTGDDVLYTLTASGGSRSVSVRVTDGPLQPGRYQLTAQASGLIDRVGNPLDGDGDGAGGDDLVRTFAVAIPAGQVLESRSNDSIPAATPLPLAEDPAGSGFLTSLIAVGALDPANDNDYWSFAARQGDRLVVDAERTSGGISPRFYVYNAAGQILVNGDSYGSFGSPPKSTAAAYAIPADGTYYVRMGNQGGTGSYQFRVDLGRSVQLEPYDFGQANNSTGAASALAYAAGAPGHLAASVAGSLYSGEGLDYYALGRLDPGNRVDVASRTISVSGLTYKVQVVGAQRGPDARPGRQPARRAGDGGDRPDG